MTAVAEGLVRRGTAATEGETRVLADQAAVGVDDLQATTHKERSVRVRFDCHLLRR
jgi:hypothetical protein